jgi:hypothetical protein
MIIIVKGVSLDDIKSSFDIEYKTTEFTPTYEKLPRYYTKETWPEQTEVPCWGCRDQYKHIPIPIVLDRGTKRVKGGFCSPEHAKRHISRYVDEDIDQREKNKYYTNLLLFCNEELGMNLTYIEDVEDFYKSPEFGW